MPLTECQIIQKDQVALDCSLEFCLSFLDIGINWILAHATGDSQCGEFRPQGHKLTNLKDDAT